MKAEFSQEYGTNDVIIDVTNPEETIIDIRAAQEWQRRQKDMNRFGALALRLAQAYQNQEDEFRLSITLVV